ncbi:titin-like [Rhineura floridana]|uniref:titin-like n=1 Tax=Rhineura floridana TaxID=261503 RepID=UPI002AC883A5|nr:titin-like [Rhineura floridana]
MGGSDACGALSEREADSLTGDLVSLKDEDSSILSLDQEDLEQEFSLPSKDSSREDVILEEVAWNSEEPSPASSMIIPEIRTEQIFSERIPGDLTVPPPSLEGMSPNNLTDEANFAIERVLGEMRANILTEAEAEVSILARELKESLEEDACCDLDEPHSIMNCRVCQLFVRTVDRLLDKSEELMDHYLPLTEEEIGNLKRAVEEIDDSGTDHQIQACLVRISDLSSKLRQRAYMMALSKLRLARRNTQQSLCQLHETLDLIEQVQQGADPDTGSHYAQMSVLSVQYCQRQGQSFIREKQDFKPEHIGMPLAQSSMIEREEIGKPLAQSTMIETAKVPPTEVCRPEKAETPPPEISRLEMAETPAEISLPEVEMAPAPISRPEKVEMAPAPISRPEKVEMAPAPISRPEKVEMAPAPISHPEVEKPPTPISQPEKVEKPPTPISRPEKVEKPPTPISRPEKVKKPPTPISRPEKVEKPPTDLIHRDVANITLTAPGCDEEDEITLRMRAQKEDDDSPVSEIEAKTLAMSLNLTENLQGTYENLLANLKDLPENLRNKLYHTCRNMAELHADFASAHHLGDLSGDLLNKSFEMMAEAQGSMDELMEYALQSPEALLWLKDHLPTPELKAEGEMFLKEKGLLPTKEEQEEEAPPSGKQVAEEWNILNIQKAYDPKGCDEETPSGKEVWLSGKQELQERNILKIQQTYDPKGCDDEAAADKAEGAVGRPYGQEMENILKIQQAYDPKGCDDEAVKEEKEEVVQPSGKEEDILKIQQAFDPKGCDEEVPSRQEKEEVPPSNKQEAREWNILKILQAYTPKFSDEEPPSNREAEVEIPSSGMEEMKGWDILKVQQAYDPKGCDEEASTNKDKEEGQLSGEWEREGWNILKIQQAYDPKGCDEDASSSKEDEVVQPSDKEVVNILKIQQAYDPRGCDNEGSMGKEEVVVQPSDKEVENILKMQHVYVPEGCDEQPPPRGEKEVIPPPSKQEAREWSILKVLQAYAPTFSDDEAPPCREEVEAVVMTPLSGKKEGKEWDILKIQQAYDPKGCDGEASTGKDEAQPSGRQEMEGWHILKIQQAYDPKGCDDDSSHKEEAGPQLGKWSAERYNIVEIQQAYDPKGCTEEDK